MENIAFSHHIPRVTVRAVCTERYQKHVEDNRKKATYFDEKIRSLNDLVLDREQKEREVEIYEVNFDVDRIQS